jgi:hypothetical protein
VEASAPTSSANIVIAASDRTERSIATGEPVEQTALRWFLDGTRMSQLARDNRIGKSTGYDCLHEGIDALATRAPARRAPVVRHRLDGVACTGGSRTSFDASQHGAPMSRSIRDCQPESLRVRRCVRWRSR